MTDTPDGATNILKHTCDAYQLSQVITEPTRITPSTSTLIDLALTNNPEKVVRSGVVRVVCVVHDLIYAYRRISVSPNVGHKFVSFRQLKKIYPNKFKADLEKVPWFLLQQYPETM